MVQKSRILVLFCLWVCHVRADDWPRWRGPDLNGVSKETGWSVSWPTAGPRQVWRASVGIGFSSVTVADGRALTLGNKDDTDTVYCFDANTGKTIWKYSYACPLDARYYEGGPGSTPTIDGQRVYTLSKRGHLFSFDAATGRVLWQKDLLNELKVTKPQWGFAGSPFVEGDLLVLNVGGAGTSVEKETGQVVWCSDRTPAGYATPMPLSIGKDRAFAIFSAKGLLAVRAKDGAMLWRYPWETRWDISAADPVWIGDRLFISTFDRGCALLEVTSHRPSPIWQNKNMANHFNSCVYLNGYIFGVHGNTDQKERELRCLDPRTGEMRWKYEGLGLGSLTAADGKLIVLSDRGELVVAEASPDRFKPLARAQVLGGKCWTVPVLANGKLYCRNAQGTLVCLDMK